MDRKTKGPPAWLSPLGPNTTIADRSQRPNTLLFAHPVAALHSARSYFHSAHVTFGPPARSTLRGGEAEHMLAQMTGE